MSHEPQENSADLLVLHTLRCIGFAGVPRVTAATGLAESDVEAELLDLAIAGLVTHLPGDFGGWGLTDAGRTADAARTDTELDAAGTRVTLKEAYNGFLVLNPELLDLCTAWQTKSRNGNMAMNDHSDPLYDRRVLDRLAEFHQRADAVCTDLAMALPRFGRYHHRLTHALTRSQSGELDFVTDSMDSYHSVWFQLHEDLLSTLGIPRF